MLIKKIISEGETENGASTGDTEGSTSTSDLDETDPKKYMTRTNVDETSKLIPASPG